jgi:HlyD family secretion protein
VLRLLRESEATVSAGAPLLEIGDPEDLEIIADILTNEAVAIRPGAPVAITGWGGAAPLEGRVRLVEPGGFTKISALGVEEQRVWVVMDLVSPRALWAALGDGFRVDARITVAVIEDATLVPVSALFRRRPDWGVFVVRDGVAQERPVVPIRRGARLAAIGDGLAPGETVVVSPPSRLRDGARVRPLAP